jgi:hypothetical protein
MATGQGNPDTTEPAVVPEDNAALADATVQGVTLEPDVSLFCPAVIIEQVAYEIVRLDQRRRQRFRIWRQCFHRQCLVDLINLKSYV